MKAGFVVVLVVVLSSTGCAPRARVLGSVRADLDNDHVTETVTITCRTTRDGHPIGGNIVVSQAGRGPVWRQSKLNPWKLEIGDVDGDGLREVIVGVWKKSPKDPVMAKRVFVYSWNGKRLMPKWLGSRLSRRFDDFAVADVNDDHWDELIALEIAPGGRHRIAVYRWLSFGFEWLGRSREMPGLKSLTRGPAVETTEGIARIRFVNGVVKLQTGGKTL